MRSFYSILCASALTLVMGSCSNTEFKKTKGGLPYKHFPSKSGQKAEPGSIMKVNFIQKINDSTLVSTYNKMPFYFPVPKPAEIQPYDISELIVTLKEGDSVYAVQLMDTFMKRSPENIPPQFKKGDRVISTIKVLNIFKNKEDAQKDELKEREMAFGRDTAVQNQLQKDIKLIDDYLAKNNIQAQKTGHGTYVQIVKPGTGPKVEVGKFVSLRYKGTALSTGKVFDSNMEGGKPALEFDVAEGKTIKGFLEGILALKKGDKARIFIPSTLGYGASAPPEIGPNQNLIFDIDVVEVAEAHGDDHSSHNHGGHTD